MFWEIDTEPEEDDDGQVRQPNEARRPPPSLVCYRCASLSSTFR